MPDCTSLHIHILPEDAAYFEGLTSTSATSTRFPGLLDIECEELVPADLNDYCKRPFFGMHGNYSGSYHAQSLCCPGKGSVFTHACDDNGALSMYATDPWSISNAPLQIASFTMQYLTVARQLVADMLDKAAKAMEVKLKELESATDTPESIAGRAAKLSGGKTAKKAPAKKAGRKPKKG
jgi:hypothetical protein